MASVVDFFTAFFLIVGTCLFLSKKYSAVDIYNCQHFSEGCPDSAYFSDKIYMCKHVLQSSPWVIIFGLCPVQYVFIIEETIRGLSISSISN